MARSKRLLLTRSINCVLLILLSSCCTMGRHFATAWKSVGGTVGPAPKISGHASCNLEKEGKVFVFGGLLEDRTVTKDVWIFNDSKKTENHWSKLKVDGNDGPGPRMYATAASLGPYVFVVGGWDPGAKGSGGTFKDDVYSLNVDTRQKWTRHKSLPCGPVSRHTACTVGDNIIIHTYKEGADAIVVLHRDGTCTTHATTGQAPQGISMCCAAPWGTDKMVLFGGSTKTQEMTNAVHVLDTTNWKWTKLENHGTNIPTPRASCCMAAVDDNSFVIFGGASIGEGGYEGGAGLQGSDETWLLTIHENNIADWTMFIPSHDTSKNPHARVAASIQKVSTENDKNKFLLTGGWDPATAETFEEPWMLE